MFRPRIIPVLLLLGKGLVKTVKYANPRYIGDPINAVRIFNDLEADELIFLDITASKEGRTISADLVRQIGDEAFMPFGVGGGVRTVDQAVNILNSGAEKIVFNTLFVKNPGEIEKIANVIGNQSVVVSIDVRKNFWGALRVSYRSGTKLTHLSPLEAAKLAESLGAGELILNYIPYDGMMRGFHLGLIQEISSNVSIPVIASCGAGNLMDFRKGFDAGAHALAAGSLFVYHGKSKGILINYPEKESIINIFKDNDK